MKCTLWFKSQNATFELQVEAGVKKYREVETRKEATSGIFQVLSVLIVHVYYELVFSFLHPVTYAILLEQIL